MTEHYTHKRSSQYVCLDKSPDVVAGRPGNENGALMYMVQASCASLGHCPPYINNAELTCVVCSK